jgi:hypothetical protein
LNKGIAGLLFPQFLVKGLDFLMVNKSIKSLFNFFSDDTSSLGSHQTYDSGIWSENGTATRIFGADVTNSDSCEQASLSSGYDSLNSQRGTGARPKTKSQVSYYGVKVFLASSLQCSSQNFFSKGAFFTPCTCTPPPPPIFFSKALNRRKNSIFQ